MSPDCSEQLYMVALHQSLYPDFKLLDIPCHRVVSTQDTNHSFYMFHIIKKLVVLDTYSSSANNTIAYYLINLILITGGDSGTSPGSKVP
jgi:hypothetical protein